LTKRICNDCKQEYEGYPTQKRCIECRRVNHNKVTSAFNKTHSETVNINRIKNRSQIQKIWGYVPYNKGTRNWWKHVDKSEKMAINFLKTQGYNKIINLNEIYLNSPFDVKAECNSKIYVFQVTMRTHIDKVIKHKNYAKALGLEYKHIFVKPDLSKCFIGVSNELSIEQLKQEELI